MKAILVIDMPIRCEDCICYRQPKYEYIGDCGVTLRPLTSAERVNRPSWCPLRPVHSLKSGGKDYIIYERQFLYDNLDREIEMMKKGKEIYESDFSD